MYSNRYFFYAYSVVRIVVFSFFLFYLSYQVFFFEGDYNDFEYPGTLLSLLLGIVIFDILYKPCLLEITESSEGFQIGYYIPDSRYFYVPNKNKEKKIYINNIKESGLSLEKKGRINSFRINLLDNERRPLIFNKLLYRSEKRH